MLRREHALHGLFALALVVWELPKVGSLLGEAVGRVATLHTAP